VHVSLHPILLLWQMRCLFHVLGHERVGVFLAPYWSGEKKFLKWCHFIDFEDAVVNCDLGR